MRHKLYILIFHTICPKKYYNPLILNFDVNHIIICLFKVRARARTLRHHNVDPVRSSLASMVLRCQPIWLMMHCPGFFFVQFFSALHRFPYSFARSLSWVELEPTLHIYVVTSSICATAKKATLMRRLIYAKICVCSYTRIYHCSTIWAYNPKKKTLRWDARYEPHTITIWLFQFVPKIPIYASRKYTRANVLNLAGARGPVASIFLWSFFLCACSRALLCSFFCFLFIFFLYISYVRDHRFVLVMRRISLGDWLQPFNYMQAYKHFSHICFIF